MQGRTRKGCSMIQLSYLINPDQRTLMSLYRDVSCAGYTEDKQSNCTWRQHHPLEKHQVKLHAAVFIRGCCHIQKGCGTVSWL